MVKRTIVEKTTAKDDGKTMGKTIGRWRKVMAKKMIVKETMAKKTKNRAEVSNKFTVIVARIALSDLMFYPQLTCQMS